ncbi:MAG TPA: hypothetical protein PK825_09730 [Bacteroidales bacterium]|nr:hypothetical protein [Bacteroidales bacterium]
MVEIFKTNVQKKTESKKLIRLLSDTYPACRINFDLSDRDKVLRVEGEYITSSEIMVLLQDHGFHCEVLD